ncbi:MAG TPA: sodium-independent anion transporter, partial [Gammaproteobacteria bacterium]|nr:sodium-independent anion transporter [Gammaproteobacteria bacterium]
ETLQIILPYAVGLSIVGLLESLMTATIVDDLTDTTSDKSRECKAQGIANIGVGFLGGMAGCAMIGQSVINIKSGGRGRLSTLVAGTALLLMVVFFEAQVSLIPMAVLVSVMIMVSIGTFNWGSIRDIKKYPITSNLVMISTVIVVVWTHNLAYGVLAGVLLAALFFANRVGHFMYVSSDYQESDDTRNYQVVGQVFFASADKMLAAFDFKEAVSNVVIDLNRAHFWDITAVSALDKAVIKFRREGALVEVRGLNEASETIIDLFSVYDKPEEIDKVLGGH